MSDAQLSMLFLMLLTIGAALAVLIIALLIYVEFLRFN